MKKGITSKIIIGIIAIIIVVGIGILVFGKQSNANLGASVYGITNQPQKTTTNPTISTLSHCIASGQFMSPPSLVVVSPNGGQTYMPGQQVTVTWKSCNLPSTTRIALNTLTSQVPNNSYGMGNGGTIVFPNTGSATVNLPIPASINGWHNGNYFKVRVLATLNPSNPNSTLLTDDSDNTFTIDSPLMVSPNGTPTAVVAAAGGAAQHNIVTFTIPFSVTANNNSAVYIPSNAAESGSATALHAVQYAVDNGGVFTLNGTGLIVSTGSAGLTPDANGNYMIPPGQTQNFNLIATYQPSVAGSYRASLVNVNWNTNDSATAYNTYTLGLSTAAYRTPYVAAQ